MNKKEKENIKDYISKIYVTENKIKEIAKKIIDPYVNWDETNILISKANDLEIRLKQEKEALIEYLKSIKW